MNNEMQARGGRMFAVSVDAPEDNARVVAEDGLPFPILSDASHDAIRAYGIVQPDGMGKGRDVAIPTRILVARDGSVLWWDSAKRAPDRPSEDEILETIRRHLG